MKYKEIYRHYESKFEAFGPNAKGMDWPDEADLVRRFEVMLRPSVEFSQVYGVPPRILDLGCGVGLFYDFLQDRREDFADLYRGIDISPLMIDAAKALRPAASFQCVDILDHTDFIQSCDVVFMNGVLTEKISLSQKEMTDFATSLISRAWELSEYALCFNVMSKHVDWEREDLFHWSFDELYQFLKEKISPHVVIRSDYGLYEYTAYVYRRSTSKGV